MRRFGIERDVELRRRRDVAVRGHRAAHDDQACDATHQRRIQLQRERDVRQRAERDDDQSPGMFVREAKQRERRMLAFGHALRRFVLGVAEPIAAVHVGRVARRMQQGRSGAGEDRRAAAHHVAQLQRVAHRVHDADVARRDRQADHLVVGRIEGHQQGERVVDAGVGIDEQRNAVHGRLERNQAEA